MLNMLFKAFYSLLICVCVLQIYHSFLSEVAGYGGHSLCWVSVSEMPLVMLDNCILHKNLKPASVSVMVFISN